MTARRFAAVVGPLTHELTVEAIDGGRWRVIVDGREQIFDARRTGNVWSLLPDGGGRVFQVDVDGSGEDLVVTTCGKAIALKLTDARKALAARAAQATRRETNGPVEVRVPMPGKVVKISVRVGDVVKAGQGVVVVEAMKMENELRAPRDGTVLVVGVREGQAVEAGQALITVGPTAGS